MATPTPDDELLSILLTNLRNATATFGEGTPPVESIRTTLEEHVQAMKSKGSATNLTSVRQTDSKGNGGKATDAAPMAFGDLAFRPRPSG